MFYTKYLKFIEEVKRQEEILIKSTESEINKEIEPVLSFINQIYDLCISNEVEVTHPGNTRTGSDLTLVNREYWYKIELTIPKNGDIIIKELIEKESKIPNKKLADFLKILDADFICNLTIEMEEISTGKRVDQARKRKNIKSLKKEIKSRFPFTYVKPDTEWNSVIDSRLEVHFKKSDL